MTGLAELVRAVDPAQIGRALATVNDDGVIHLGLTLLGRVGLCPAEATGLTVTDYDPTTRKLRVAESRTIRIADVAADELDAYLAGAITEPGELLLPGPSRRRMSKALRQSGGLILSDLRAAALQAALDSELPKAYVQAYFGYLLRTTPKTLIALPEDYDVAVANVLNQVAFA